MFLMQCCWLVCFSQNRLLQAWQTVVCGWFKNMGELFKIGSLLK